MCRTSLGIKARIPYAAEVDQTLRSKDTDVVL